MKTVRRLPSLAGLLLLSSTAGAASFSCHLHSPENDMTSEDEPSIIPNTGNPAQCETLNQQRFAGMGRCHCSFGKIRQRGFALPDEPVFPERGLP